MNEGLRRHLPIVVITGLLCIAAGAFALMQIHDRAASMDVSTFSLWIIIAPCAAMVIFSFIVMVTASEINRQLFLAVVGMCFAAGVVSMIVTSMWIGDATLASQLVTNSPEGTTITPPADSPLIVIRNLAAYVVSPTVGSIAGAWLGSRLHPMKSTKVTNRKGR